MKFMHRLIDCMIVATVRISDVMARSGPDELRLSMCGTESRVVQRVAERDSLKQSLTNNR